MHIMYYTIAISKVLNKKERTHPFSLLTYRRITNSKCEVSFVQLLAVYIDILDK